MKTVEIPDALFSRLQKLAIPLVDTPVTVLERLLSFYEAQQGLAAKAEPTHSKERRISRGQSDLDAGKPPSLRHTRVLNAEFAGRKADAWNNLMQIAHIEAALRLGSVEMVRRMSSSKMILGRANSEQEEKGYRYVPEINACIQNTDAQHAWTYAFRLAKALKVPIEVEFQWLEKDQAAHPGRSARMAWKPKENDSPAY